MERPSKLAAAAALVAILGAVTLLPASARPATDPTSTLSQALADAVFAQRFAQVWDRIEPSYRARVARARWQRCVEGLVAQSRGYRVKSIRVAGSRRVPSTLPMLGRVTLVDVSLQVLYTVPASSAL